VRRAQPHARIVCCGVPDVGVSPIFAESRAAITALSRRDDAAARAAAARDGATFVDLYTITHAQSATRGRFLSHDRFHPSDAGYALFAAALEPVLLAAVSRRA
jgi:lysophospholipase L1-like esterase